MSKVKVFYHGNCFDGVVSAALFSEMFLLGVDQAAEFTYRPLANKPGAFDAESFDGDINAIVDFRYHPDAEWWVDHHAKGVFADAVEEAHFLADGNNQKFYEPDYKSCARLIANVARSKFGIHDARFENLAVWADRIDGAQFTTAADAADLDSPAARLTAVLESTPDAALSEFIIRSLRTVGLADTAHHPDVQSAFEPLRARHQRISDFIAENARLDGDVLFLDALETDFEGANKFVPYALFPSTRYNVFVSRKGRKIKVAVGHNPFGERRTHDIGSICEGFNGGGHAGVGAAWYEADEIEKARFAAREITRTLQS